MQIDFTAAPADRILPFDAVRIVPFDKQADFSGRSPFSPDDYLAALRRTPKFTHGEEKILTVHGPSTVLTVDLTHGGKPETARAIAAPLLAAMKHEGAERDFVLDLSRLAPENCAAAAHLIDALRIETYTYGKWKTGPEKNPGPSRLLVTGTPDEVHGIYAKLKKDTDAAFWASDLVNDPPNVLTPGILAAKTVAAANDLPGVTAAIFGDVYLKTRGMNAFFAVGQGSAQRSHMVVLQYDGSEGRQKRPLALVGKGITFDSGGLQIKDGASMEEMRMDMGGAAAVAGAFLAAVRGKTTANIAAVLPLAENMPSGTAIAPTAIVKSYSGKTIEIVDTDAEGRLVLADAMTYAQRDLNAKTVVTAATLTGAVCVALGLKRAGVFTENKSLLKTFAAASRKSGENIWHLPMGKEYEEMMTEGTPADIKNYGGKWGGASTAAAFLNVFIDKDAKDRPKAAFAHLDLAGPAMPKTDLKGWGVRLLAEVVRAHEPKPRR